MAMTGMGHKLVILFVFLFQSLCFANFEYQRVQKKDGSVLSGQLIGHYLEQWFWETEPKGDYIALFNLQNGNPKIHFIESNEISSQIKWYSSESQYIDFLKANQLMIGQPPLSGWNYVSTGNEGHHLYENMFGNFAWDISKENLGKTHFGEGLGNSDYFVWGERVLAPVSGTVIDIANNEKDYPADPSFLSDLSERGDGNYVLIDVGNGFYFSLIHFMKNSIPKYIQPGTKVKQGDFIGLVGNSGVTFVPHLHMTMFYWSDSLQRMMSVPTMMSNLEVKLSDVGPIISVPLFTPRQGHSIQSGGL